jgi:glycosyltransferase involved in cell wall biosynthesis
MVFRISIVTVSLNQVDYIEENILSVLNQRYPNCEHIIIDGCSTDGTQAVLARYNHLVWKSEPDRGQSHALNKGFKMATGDIIGWINSDDRLYPGALQIVNDYFENHQNEIGVVGDQAVIDMSSKLVKVIKSRAYDFGYLLNEAKGITQNSIFFKKAILEKVGYIDERLHYAMDRDFFIRVARLQRLPYLPETLSEFRIQPNSKTSEGTYKFAWELIRIRKKYGGNFFSPAGMNDIYVLSTQPLRCIKPLRTAVQRLRGWYSR